MEIYITFGQEHAHVIGSLDNDIVAYLNHDSVARIECRDYSDGREKAFKLFGDKWCFSYTKEEWVQKNIAHYFPRGVIDV